MTVVSVIYPAKEGSRFDLDYYMKKHIPLVHQRWDALGLRGVRVLKGIGAPDGKPAPYQMMALLEFDSAEAFARAVQTHGHEVMGDVPNFTDIHPTIQLNEPVS